MKGNEVKIIDFGISHLKNSSNTYTSTVSSKHTFKYASPESMDYNLEISSKVDVYSFGIIVWEIFNNKTNAFEGLGQDEVLKRSISDRKLKPKKIPIEIPKKWPQNIRDLITQCLSFSPKDRPELTSSMI